jgi:predicted RNase H-like nuclease
MDIHKPKPWHGVREFLKEYLIIVVGVLTALGAEQAVEWVHQRSEAAEAREVLRAEIEHDVRTIRANTQQDRCMHPYLKRAVAWAEGGARPPAGPFFFNELSSSAWDTAKTGAVSHMPLTDRLAYVRFYERVATYNALVSREWDITARIGALWRLGTLNPDEARALKLDALNYDGLLRIKIAQQSDFERRAKALGIKAPELRPQDREYLARICALVTAPPTGPAKPTDGF